MNRLEDKNVALESILEKQSQATGIVRTALNQSGTHALVFSGGPASTVLLDIIWKEIRKEISFSVFHIELIAGFSKIYQYLEKIERLWNFKMIRSKNDFLLDQVKIDFNWEELYNEHTQRACHALSKNYGMTHLFRADSGKSQIAETEKVHTMEDPNPIEVRPLRSFTLEDLWSYIQKNNLPYCSLFSHEYKKIHPGSTWRGPEHLTLTGDLEDTEAVETVRKLRSLGYLS